MRSDHDSSQLTPDERCVGVAAILATGLLRLRDRAALGGSSAVSETLENPAAASLAALDLRADPSVTGQAG